MIYDSILVAYRNIKERKARSFLTFLGIAVGIAAIIALIAVGTGMQSTVTKELVSFADIIAVMPGQMIPGRYIELGAFTQKDVADMGRISGIKEVTPMVMKYTEVEYRRERVPIEIIGGDPRELESMWGGYAELQEGRWIYERDYKGCVIGYSVAHEYFDNDVNVGDRLIINGTKFVVVGVFKKAGTMASTDIDPHIFLTTKSAKDVLGTDDISFVMVRVRDINRADEIAREIEEKINENHNLEFAHTMTASAITERIITVLLILQAVLVGIASIALIVGCIGIMNTMLMSVMERTHEIGIMKAIGATNGHIMSMFLLESGIISLIGGVFGCVLGVVAAKLVGMGISAYVGMDVPAIITWQLVVGAAVISVLVGVISGVQPARRAAMMSPVEAVRYE
jgi:putative ABC transport system permease protein